jgi:YesN/AraC family two-component response regulator
LRISKACDLILSSDYMVYEIAYKVGFSNPTYFSSVFKKKTGVSPGQYRKNRK